MIKILDTVLQIEEESKTKVQEAQKKAREIKEKAEKENTERLDAARNKAASSLMDSINQTKKEWEDKVRQALSSQDTMYSGFIKTHNSEIEQTADKILDIVKRPRHKTIHE